VDANGMPVRVIITQGTTADCKQAGVLVEGINADVLFADRAYDSNEIIAMAKAAGITANA